jgi:SAM-dependent methyltransferase
VSFDRIADRYDATRGGDRRPETTAEALEEWLPRGEPVVEVGVGTGLIAGELRERGWPVVGFDLAPRMLAEAVPRIGRRVAVADAQQLPVRDRSVGSVYFVHVLHVVADMGATLAEAARVTRPGGRVVAVSAAGAAARDRLTTIMGELRDRLSGPRPDVPDRVVEAARAAGLRVVHRGELIRSAQVSAESLAVALEQRVWSWTWDVPDDVWASDVEPVIAELRAMPDADRAIERTGSRAFLVFEAA